MGQRSEGELLWVRQRKIKNDRRLPIYLLLGFKDVTPEDIAGTVSSDIAEDLQVLGIMRDVEDPIGRATEKCTEDGIRFKSPTRKPPFKGMLKTELASSCESRWHFQQAPDTPRSELQIQKWGHG